MKKILLTFAAGAALLASIARAEISIITVDMQRLYKEYYKTEEAFAKIQSSAEQAQETRQELYEAGQAMVAELNELNEKAQNPALSEEARAEAQAAVEEKTAVIREKELELRQFQENTRRSLMQRQQTHRDLMVDEITAEVIAYGKDKGADLIFDTSAPEGTGIIPSVVYAKEAWDVTDAVLTKLNADAPAN